MDGLLLDLDILHGGQGGGGNGGIVFKECQLYHASGGGAARHPDLLVARTKCRYSKSGSVLSWSKRWTSADTGNKVVLVEQQVILWQVDKDRTKTWWTITININGTQEQIHNPVLGHQVVDTKGEGGNGDANTCNI